MDNRKIAFIICVNNNRLYREAEIYIRNLNIPEGFKIEIIPIFNAESMTSGYNSVMKRNNAKYKVYLHQDLFIINKNFIFDILKIFDENKAIGLIGLAGAEDIPSNGMWGYSENKVGRVYHIYDNFKIENSLFGKAKMNINKVEVVDGLLMATQYDIEWRQDIFDGWHFYDLSQCLEFKKNGYFVVVPKQEETWAMHECGVKFLDENYEKYRLIFLSEYKSYILDRGKYGQQ